MLKIKEKNAFIAMNKANIDNLTSLWKKMGTQPHSVFTVNELNASNSWPNRYWFDWDTDTNKISAIDETLIQLSQHSIVSVWDGVAGNAKRLEARLVEHGFEIAFEQTAMYLLSENNTVVERPPVKIVRIHTRRDIETWTNISGLAFAYKIDTPVIHKIAGCPNIRLFLAYREGQAAATAMLYKTADIIGVHQVGVVEKHQRQGLAFALMQHVIEACIAWQGKYVTLQASKAGAALYKRLGFIPNAKIRNYRRVCK